jgi:hypothetical protein
MLNIFTKPSDSNRGSISIPGFRVPREGLLTNISRVKEYYRENNFGTKSNHLLVRILQTLHVSLNHDVNKFHDLVTDQSYTMGSHFNLVSPMFKGGVQEKSNFYGNNVDEIIISVNNLVDPVEAANNWRTLEPLRVLYHPFTDLCCYIPNNISYTEEEGVAIIAIDIPLLAIQYRQWRLEQMRTRPENQQSMRQFLYQYPLCNMLDSHVDIAFFNRLDALLNDSSPVIQRRRHPLALPDYTSKLDDCLVDLLAILVKKRTTYQNMAEIVPMLYKESLLDVLLLPDILINRQDSWAILLAQLPYIAFLVEMGRLSKSSANKQEYNIVRRQFIRAKQDKLLEVGLPDNIANGIYAKFSELTA